MALLYHMGRLICFGCIYVGRSSLEPYLMPDAFALVTGSTDGIGKAIALELAGRGFHVILHGRSAVKLDAVRGELLKRYPNIKVVVLLHDGVADGSLLDVSLIRGLHVTVLVNNVGVGPLGPFEAMPAGTIEGIVRLNILFSTRLTQALLPCLGKGGLILNVSSYAGIYPPPYLAVYAGSKAYNDAFSRSLSVELVDVRVISLLTGSVHTNSNRKPVTFMRPDAGTFARSVVQAAGRKCVGKRLYPYWPHAVQAYVLSLLPARMMDRAMRKAMQRELEGM